MSLLELAFQLTPRLPEPILSLVASLTAAIDHALSPTRREGLRHNLEAIGAWGHPLLATPAARRAVERAIFRSYHVGFLGYLAQRRTPAHGAREPRFVGAERLYRALSHGRGAVVTAPHLGNWELAVLSLARLGFVVHVVTGLQFHASVSRAARAAKESARIAVSTPEDGFLPLLGTLKRGGLVILLADGDVYARGIPVRLFGAPSVLPAGPALLARRADAPIVHAFTVRESGGAHRIVFESAERPDRALAVADDVARLTEGVARALERAVAANITQWCIFRPMVAPDGEPAAAARGVVTHAA
ncbi:MAG TPA: lysophospholipid acyltransferase family protein [Candidatus Eisenbacteria bacterium]|nr:lysophospholipid acyltransferase family protein [Candidatus Eisenbacteria bacterium]